MMMLGCGVVMLLVAGLRIDPVFQACTTAAAAELSQAPAKPLIAAKRDAASRAVGDHNA